MVTTQIQSRNPFTHVAFAGILILLAAAACAPSAPSGPVRVVMAEWSVRPSVSSVPAGRVTLELVNQGKVKHELVILKTNLAVASLKMRPTEPDKVDEEAGATNEGEFEDVKPGETKSASFDLTAGHYLLICNQPEHYKAGMAVAFEVK